MNDMKLKWKLFLVSLAFIMTAVGITAITVLHITFASSVNSHRANTASYGSYFMTAVGNEITNKMLRENSVVLTSEQVGMIISAQCENYTAFGASAGVTVTDQNGTTIGSGGNTEHIDPSKLPPVSQLEKGKCSTCIYDNNGSTFILGAFLFEAERNNYVLYTLHDITSTYRQYDSLFRTSGFTGIAVGVIISIILLCILIILLRPLSRLKSSIKKISRGDYSARVKEEGSAELKEIAESFNIMAEVVENNTERLEGIADGRKRYVDSLAHEMKTPLTSILCYGDLMRIKKRVEDTERLEYAGIIVDEAKRLKSLSSKLLELATADSAELDFKEHSVLSIMKEAESSMGEPLEARGIKLNVMGQDGNIYCDKELFKSLLYNLIDNAAKASPVGGSINVISRCEKNGIVIAVEDHGIGMTKDVLRKVTEPFYMADKSRSRAAGGAGLGLSLCLEIAKRHRARLTAKSRPGVGTTVFITVPYAEEGVRLVEGKTKNP